MEEKEMTKGFAVLAHLIRLRENSRATAAMKDQINILEQELQFLVIFWNILIVFNYGIHRDGKHLYSVAMKGMEAIRQKEGFLATGIRAMRSGRFRDWETLVSELLGEIKSYRQSIREDMSFFSDGLYNSNSFSINSLLEFIRHTDTSMVNLLQLKSDQMNPDEKMKFESTKQKLGMFRVVFNFVKGSQTFFKEFQCALNAWACNAAYLCLFYWVHHETMASHEKNRILSKLYQSFDSPHPEVTEYCSKYLESKKIVLQEEHYKDSEIVSPNASRICLSYLQAVEPSAKIHQEVCEIYFGSIESLNWNLRAYLPKETIQMLFDSMLSLIAFVTDPLSSVAEEGQLALSITKEVLKKVGIHIISLGSDKKDEADILGATNFLLHDFFEMIITIQAEVRKAYPLLFLDSSFNFPRLNVLNLLDSSIEKIKEFPIHFSKHPIMTFEKELVVIRDLVKTSSSKDNFVILLQNESLGLKDLWTRISNVAYQVDRIITTNTNKGSLGIDIFFLLDVQQELKHLCPLVKRMKDKYLQDSHSETCRTEMNSIDVVVPLKSDDVQEVDEFVVGFDDKVKDIRGWLTNESKTLDIMSIFGMAGLGKTTLAKKVYKDSSVKTHFTTCAWCTISQSYDSKKIMLDILKDITEVNVGFIKMEEEDLADKLRKCLMGKRYLIVMDDLWDNGAWDALKLCFPDNEKHSRILVTTRIYNVVSGVKCNSDPYLLTQLSDQESFELLKRRIFHDKDIFPTNFVECGEKIARDCKGLPLAIALVAGLLKKEIDNLNWWKQIGETLDSRIYKGGCYQILELSYKHLSEPLRACFLYLGLFEEDKVIQVQKLINLWVSEGFIQVNQKESVEIVAQKYLMDLVTRSLLIICSKSSRGGVKTCRIHDLLREFCLEKGREEHFFTLLHGKNVSQDTMDEHYRVSVESQHLKHFVVRKSSPLHSIRICVSGTSNAFNVSPSSFCNGMYLHVLDLEDVRLVGEFPNEITTLIFLRYLAMRCTTECIPTTIKRLQRLETLRVVREGEIDFPAEISQIESLRHVHIGKFNLSYKFHHLLPMKNIQSFSTPYLSNLTEVQKIENFLTKLKVIQKLKCTLFEQKEVIKFNFLHQLVSLNLIHEGRPLLRQFGFSLPTGIKKLTLSNFGLSWSALSRIARLPNLEVLKLLENAFIGNLWNMKVEDQFKRLKFLKLRRLNVKKWNASEENFPCLEQIIVEHCYILDEIPIEFVEISSLQKIQIRRCCSSLVKSAKEIMEQQMELGNLNFNIEAIQILPEMI